MKLSIKLRWGDSLGVTRRLACRLFGHSYSARSISRSFCGRCRRWIPKRP